MHTEIKFNNKVAYHGKKWGTATGIHMMRHDTIDAPSPNGIEVVNITPTNRAGLSSTSIELPVEQLPEIITEMMKVAGIDPVEFAKNTLVAAGYVDFFVSSEEVRSVATDMQRELTDDELASVVKFLSQNDLETGLCELAIEGAISEICPDATDQEWEEDSDNEEDESDEFRHIINQYTPDGQADWTNTEMIGV